MQPFTKEQIEAVQEYIGGRTHLIEWMEKLPEHTKCTRCGTLEHKDVLASGLCPDCYTDQRGK